MVREFFLPEYMGNRKKGPEIHPRKNIQPVSEEPLTLTSPHAPVRPIQLGQDHKGCFQPEEPPPPPPPSR